MKRYLVPCLATILLVGCGTNLDSTDLNPEDTIGTSAEIVSTSETVTEVTRATTITTIATTTSIPPNENIIVLTDPEETTILTTVETTTSTTTNILSNYGDEEQLIEIATLLYEVACEIYWNYYDGSPYSLDYDDYIENDDGIIYFLVDEDDINSLEDVKEHWFKIFSSRNDPEDFNGHFIESNGKVYANDGNRGANIFYTDTEITEILSISDDEITFNAVSHYASPEDNSPMEDESNEFSIILENGSYHVGEFTLPY